jgi:DNA-binding CsgD family transcriptional regulator/RNA polymerase subunit RPABC4/transcription elongation factor Spt4
MKYGVQDVSIKALMRKGWFNTEMRVKPNSEKARQYAAEMDGGCKFPRPVVFCDPKSELFMVGDGFHRILAHAINRKKNVEVDLRRGTYTDAVLWNIEANRKQLGMPLTTGDIEKCVLTLLQNDETKVWTQTKIAEVVGCANSYVSKIAKKNEVKRPDKVIASNGHIRVGHHEREASKTVEKRREYVLGHFLKGTPRSEIADKLGLSENTIGKDIQEAFKERHLIHCPHCNGTGMISNITGAAS